MTGPRSQSEQQAEISQSSHHRDKVALKGHIQGPSKVVDTSGGDRNQRVRPKAYIPLKLACVHLLNLSCHVSHLEKKLTQDVI